MNKSRLYWALQFGAWFSYAAFQLVGAAFVASGQRLTAYLPLISEALFFILITHCYRYFMTRWHWLELPATFIIPRGMIISVIMGLVIYLLRAVASIPLGVFNPEVFFSWGLLANTFINALLLFFWTVCYFIYHYFERYNHALKYEAASNEIELNQLKSQLNPHFIFNALNSIRALVDEDPGKSKKAITQLSNILRNSLVTGKKRLTRLDDEISTVKDYLSLETIRFEERLKTEFDIKPDSLDCLVPPLMIQTLVENGIKHGISQLKEGGVIILKTEFKNNRLHIEIRNSGSFEEKKQERRKTAGIGIENTRQRLKLIFGDDAHFNISNEQNNIVLTKLSIPQQVEEYDESAYSRRREVGKKRIGQFA